MAFPPEFLDEIRGRVPLADVVGRRVRLQKRGREFHGLCPFHKEKTPSFTVSEDKGFYHCFGCGAHGDVIGFVMHGEGLSFPEAVERLAGEAGLAVPSTSPEDRAAARRRADLGEVLEAAAGWFELQLRGAAGAEARDYLARRGIEPAAVEQFRLGFAPDRRGALLQAMASREIGKDLLAEAGLIKLSDTGEAPQPAQGAPRDYFFNRIIFPISDPRGRVIAFGGRALGDSRAKYLNSPDTPLFHKGRVLYNLSRARQAARDGGELLVTEGYMDVIALTQAGFPAAVAPLGTAITEAQIEQLWRVVPEPTLCLDGDSAGQRAAYRAVDRALPLLKPGCSLKFATLPQGEDPDSLLRARGAGAMRQLIEEARPMAEVLWQRETAGQKLDTPERRAGLRQRLLAAARTVRDEGVRAAYDEHLRSLFDQRLGYRPPGAGRSGGRSSGRPGGWPGRWPGGWQGGASGRRSGKGWGQSAWGPPPRPLGTDRDPAGLQRRQDQVMLATLVNHPEILAEAVEEVAHLDFADAAYQRFGSALADLICGDPALDTEHLKCHLIDQGFDAILDAVLSRNVYSLGPFARPEASPSVAREGWSHLLTARRDRLAAMEGEAAADRLAAQMSEDTPAQVRAEQGLEGETGAEGPELDWADTAETDRSE